MPAPDGGPDDGPGKPAWVKLAWFAGYWLASITALTVVAYAIRLAIR